MYSSVSRMTLIRLPVVTCTDKLLSSILEYIAPEQCICSTTHRLPKLEDGYEDGVFGISPFFAFRRCKVRLDDGCQLRRFCTGVVVVASLTDHSDYKGRLEAHKSTWRAKGIYLTWRRRVKPESMFGQPNGWLCADSNSGPPATFAGSRIRVESRICPLPNWA
jgi:hypothetical protein